MAFTKKRLIVAIFPVLLLSSGCLCCNIPSSGGGETTTTAAQDTVVVCNLPYMRFGAGCCLDADRNGICDADETTVPVTTAHTDGTEGTQASTTQGTLPQASSTLQASSTTTRPPGPEASCVAKYGLSPDTVVYLYTRECCDSTVTPMVSRLADRGYSFKSINLASPSPAETSIILCFYSSMPQFVPEFLCPASGDSILITGYDSPQSKISAFAKKCREAAGFT